MLICTDKLNLDSTRKRAMKAFKLFSIRSNQGTEHLRQRKLLTTMFTMEAFQKIVHPNSQFLRRISTAKSCSQPGEMPSLQWTNKSSKICFHRKSRYQVRHYDSTRNKSWSRCRVLPPSARLCHVISVKSNSFLMA